MWLPCSPIGVQSLEFAPQEPFAVDPWQVYVPPGDGLWPMPGIQWVAVPTTALSRGTSCYSVSCPPVIQSIWRGIQPGGLGSHPIPPHSLHGEECSFPGLLHQASWSIPHLWLALNLAILIWCWVPSGWCIYLHLVYGALYCLIKHTMGSQVRC